MNNLFEIKVYIDNGLIYCYDVASVESAREHSAAIVSTGQRHVGSGSFTHYPPYRILKVKVLGDIQTNYPDRVEGT